MVLTIAMDGPVGAGKSSVADEVARRLGILHLDTGAMYRCVAYQAQRLGVDVADEAALATMIDAMQIDFDSDHHVYINGEDVSRAIR